MTLYLSLLKAFLNHEIYKQYYQYLDLDFIKKSFPIIYRLFLVVELMHKRTPNTTFTENDLELSYHTNYPSTTGTQEFDAILDRLRGATAADSSIEDYLKSLRLRSWSTELAKSALAVAEGVQQPEKLDELISNKDSFLDLAIPEEEEEFVTSDLESLITEQVTTNGLRWHLPSLNRSLGSLRRGDFGFVFARPETGKTTFLAHAVAAMVQQTDRPVLWFNNEEQGSKVILRCYSAVLGKTLPELSGNMAHSREVYRQLTGDRIRVVHDTQISKGRIEKMVERYDPALVIFDQIDKIRGFAGDRNDLELSAIYFWARGIAQQYCPVIGVCQAGGTGEGKKYLTMNDVDNSKTGKQAEADWILGIGKVFDEGLENVRFLNISKNKLFGDMDSDPRLKHAHWETIIQPEIARYRDFD